MPCPPPGDLPDAGIKPTSPALAGGFFTTSAPWEAHLLIPVSINPSSQNSIPHHVAFEPRAESEMSCILEKCLGNPMDRGAWKAAVHGVAKSRTRLSDFTFTFHFSCIGEGNGNPLQCSCLENPRDGGVWGAAVYGVAQSRTQLKRLSSSSSSL